MKSLSGASSVGHTVIAVWKKTIGRKGGKEGGREGGWEGGREGGKEWGREGRREGGREGGRKGGRRGWRARCASTRGLDAQVSRVKGLCRANLLQLGRSNVRMYWVEG
jgi:hypothetical protein